MEYKLFCNCKKIKTVFLNTTQKFRLKIPNLYRKIVNRYLIVVIEKSLPRIQNDITQF